MKLNMQDVVFAYADGLVIDQLSVTVHEGEFVSLIGPSGSGKSTLFYLLGGMFQPQSGQIQLNGQSIIGETGMIGYMPQQPSLLPWRTVEQNILLGCELNRSISQQVDIDHLLGKARLLDAKEKYPYQLSGGMQQRVALLRTMASNHQLLCLDEPFASLDILTRQAMQRWLWEILLDEQRSILFITHSVEEALLLSDRIYVLSNRPLSVKTEYKIPIAREVRMEQKDHEGLRALRKEVENQLSQGGDDYAVL